MRTKIWMTPWESVGKGIVTLAIAVAFAKLAPIEGEGGERMGLPLALFAFCAVFSFCFAAYELVGRALGSLGERLFARDDESTPGPDDRPATADAPIAS